MEKPTRTFLTPDVLGSVLKEHRYRNRIFVAPGLKHNLLEEQNLQSRGAGQDGCPRSMAWKHLLRTHCAELALPDMESHLQAFCKQIEKE